jgi:Domain of unknown function (DUF4389)
MEAGVGSHSAVGGASDHPIALVVADDLKRSRLTVFFRLLLVIPHVVWIYLWGVAAGVAVIVAWFAALFTGRVPAGLHNFNAAFLRYSTRVTGYVFLLADPWPPCSTSLPYPIDVRVDPAAEQSRVTVLFRIVLAIPAVLLVYVFRAVNQIVALVAWFYCLALGRMHEGMRNLSAWLLRYEVQTYAYVMLLTGRYPSFAGAPTV